MADKTIELGYHDYDAQIDSSGSQTSASIPYFIFNAEDEDDALAFAYEQLSSWYGEMSLRNIKIGQRINESTFKVSANYAYDSTNLPETSTSETYALSFDLSGQSLKLYQSEKTIGKYPDDAPDYGGAINYDGKKVKGVDIEIPIFTWTEKHSFSDSQLTQVFKNNLKDAYGKMNQKAFRSYAPGEVKFGGVTGSKSSKKAKWELTFKFLASPNKINFKVGDITVLSKLGWDYMWIKYKAKLADGELIHKPKAVYIERVLEFYDFKKMGI